MITKKKQKCHSYKLLTHSATVFQKCPYIIFSYNDTITSFCSALPRLSFEQYVFENLQINKNFTRYFKLVLRRPSFRRV